MSPRNKLSVVPRLDARLTAYAVLAGVALTAPATVKAAVVESGVINLNVPNNFDGVYLNFLTGATGSSGASVPGWDFNPYNSGTSLSFFWNGTPANSSGGVGGTTTGPYLNLALGSMVGPGSTFTAVTATAATSAFRGGTGFLGFRFFNEATGSINYGYAQLSSTGPSGFPLTIVRYAYENSGTAITVVPEPTTTALLGVMAVGAVGLRAWRKRKAV